MTADISFHYPPELFNLLVDAIPLLNRSKKDVLQFFRGAGAPAELIAALSARLKQSPTELNK
jgi:restriction system protein